MAATMLIRELNGAGPTATDKTSGTIRFKNADNATVDTSDPLVVPGSGQEYSYRKVARAYVNGTFTEVSNLRAYSDGTNSFGTGRELWYAVTETYVQPSVPNEANDPPEISELSPPVVMSDFFGSSSGSPIDMDGLNTGPFDDGSVPKEIGDYLNMAFEVNSTSSQGVVTGETLTLSWDEI